VIAIENVRLFTELRDSLERLKAAQANLIQAEKMASLGQLTAGIAHEFRNGLATIHGYSRLLNLDALPAQFRPYVEGIRAETESMREVVTNFLNFAKPDQPTLSPVDLGAIAERAADDLRADARALAGDIHVVGEFATIEGDDVLPSLPRRNVVFLANGNQVAAHDLAGIHGPVIESGGEHFHDNIAVGENADGDEAARLSGDDHQASHMMLAHDLCGFAHPLVPIDESDFTVADFSDFHG